MNTLAAHFPDQIPYRERRAKTGLRFLLAAITSLFFLFSVALLIRSQYHDWEPLTAPWNPLSNPATLWINTFFLALSSASMQWARTAARRGKPDPAWQAMLLAGLFTLLFIAGQLWLWRQLITLGFYASANPANGFFYMLTGMHALHMAGGLVAWLRTARKRKPATANQFTTGIDLCATYWHYLLGIWLVLFVLLASSPETFAAIASFCGF